MKKTPKNEYREYRIHDEAIVDAYGETERAMSWYYYMDDKLRFPIKPDVLPNAVLPL